MKATILRYLPVCIFYTLFIASPANAQGPRELAAERLANAVLTEAYFNETVNQAATTALTASRAAMERAIKRSLSETEVQKLTEIWTSVIKEVLPRPKWKTMMISVYLRNLTLEEMNLLTEFYKHPVASKMPRLLVEGSESGRAMAQEHQREIGEAFFRALDNVFPNMIPVPSSRPAP
jgi:hypothetical protein